MSRAHADRPTAKELAKLVRSSETKTQALEKFGRQIPRTTFNEWIRHAEIELGEEIKPAGRAPKSLPEITRTTGEAAVDADAQAVLAVMGDHPLSVVELADLADLSPSRTRAAAERLASQGYRIELDEDQARLPKEVLPTDRRFEAGKELFDGDWIKFGVVSDTHFGSKADHPHHVQTAYEVMAERGVRQVYHPGDLIDGLGIYRGHVSELKVHTVEDHLEYVLEKYPDGSALGIRTAIIGGNHDLEGDIGRVGADPVAQFCQQREDFDYLGRYSAWVDLPNGANMHLLHPKGGASYASSYRPQKIVEGYEGGLKPNVLLCGHYHRAGLFPVRGVQTLLAGTFQGSTTFSVRLAMGQPGFGFWIVEACLADDSSLVRFKSEFCPFYLGREI